MWIFPSPSTIVSSLYWQLIYYIHLYGNILCSSYVCLSIRQLNDARLRKSSVKCFDFDVKQPLHHVKYMHFSSVSVIHRWEIYALFKKTVTTMSWTLSVKWLLKILILALIVSCSLFLCLAPHIHCIYRNNDGKSWIYILCISLLRIKIQALVVLLISW